MGQLMRSTLLSIVAGCFGVSLALAQFGGRADEVVIYTVSSKGNTDLQIVAPTTVNTQTGFQVIDPVTQPVQPFGPDFPGEFFVPLHLETGDNFRFIIQKEGILTQHNMFQGPAKVMIVKGLDRLILPEPKAPIDLTAGLFAPFPQGVDFGPELPIFEANSFLWTPSPIFPLLKAADPSFISPLDPPGLTGSEYVLTLGQFGALIPWVELNTTYPGAGWPQGINARLVDQDTALGSTIRMIRLRPGRHTPPFVIRANTHLAVLQGSVTIQPLNGTPTVLTQNQYAFIPNGFAITLSNPTVYSGPTGK
jgi:hypothetical protein